MSKLPLYVFCTLICFWGTSLAQPSGGDIPTVKPITDEQQVSAAALVEEAIPMDQLGAENILDAQGSFSTQYQAVVKVENAFLTPNYSMPWLPGQYGRGTGTAFLIGENLFMTNAHVVSNAQRLYISKYGESRKIPASVVHIAHDCDLALLKVEDYTPFEKMTPFKIGALPQLEDEVRAIGYPIGGERLSVTRGVVSRIDRVNYSHTMSDSHLVIQIDAAINPGNSGGPILMGDRVVGVAFQGLSQADNTGYVIPTPVIDHFLKDISDGKYDGYVGLGVVEIPILNSAMRTQLGLPDDEKGVLVGEIYKSGSAAGILKPGDVILSLDGKVVDSSGKVEIDGETVNMNELAERKFSDDIIKVEFLRDKKKEAVELKVKPTRSRSVLAAAYDVKPRYVVFGGLLFQPGERNVILGHQLRNQSLNVELEDFVFNGGTEEWQDYVIITNVLRDEVNDRLLSVKGKVVDKVNGVRVKGLSHLYELLNPKEEPDFFVFELKDDARPVIFETKQLKEANKRVSAQYKIEKDHYLVK